MPSRHRYVNAVLAARIDLGAVCFSPDDALGTPKVDARSFRMMFGAENGRRRSVFSARRRKLAAMPRGSGWEAASTTHGFAARGRRGRRLSLGGAPMEPRKRADVVECGDCFAAFRSTRGKRWSLAGRKVQESRATFRWVSEKFETRTAERVGVVAGSSLTPARLRVLVCAPEKSGEGIAALHMRSRRKRFFADCRTPARVRRCVPAPASGAPRKKRPRFLPGPLG